MIKCRKLAKAQASSSLKVLAGLARLGDKFLIRARRGPGLKASGISQLSWARARKEVEFPIQAQLRLGHNSGFELGVSSGWNKKYLGSIHPGTEQSCGCVSGRPKLNNRRETHGSWWKQYWEMNWSWCVQKKHNIKKHNILNNEILKLNSSVLLSCEGYISQYTP